MGLCQPDGATGLGDDCERLSMDGSSAAHPLHSRCSRSWEDVVKAVEVSRESGMGSQEEEKRHRSMASTGDALPRARGAGPSWPSSSLRRCGTCSVCESEAPVYFATTSPRTPMSGQRWVSGQACCWPQCAHPASPVWRAPIVPALGAGRWHLGMSLIPLAIGQVLKDTMGTVCDLQVAL